MIQLMAATRRPMAFGNGLVCCGQIAVRDGHVREKPGSAVAGIPGDEHLGSGRGPCMKWRGARRVTPNPSFQQDAFSWKTLSLKISASL
jgi:hypothetical protein